MGGAMKLQNTNATSGIDNSQRCEFGLQQEQNDDRILDDFRQDTTQTYQHVSWNFEDSTDEEGEVSQTLWAEPKPSIKSKDGAEFSETVSGSNSECPWHRIIEDENQTANCKKHEAEGTWACLSANPRYFPGRKRSLPQPSYISPQHITAKPTKQTIWIAESQCNTGKTVIDFVAHS